MKKDIILSGVDGQGVPSIATIVGQAALKNGSYMKQAEVHGMGQQGDNVQSNLRVSNQLISSDLVPTGKYNLIISLEPMETSCYLPYLSPEGWLVANEAPFINTPHYLTEEALKAELDELPHKIVLDASEAAREVDSPRVANIVLLRVITPFLGINYQRVRDSTRDIFQRRGEIIAKLNLKIPAAGKEIVENLIQVKVLIAMNDRYWEEEIETMSRGKLRELQLQRLKKTINTAANSPYYKQVFQKYDVAADSIRSVDDIRKISFTTRADMRANYPFRLVAGNMQEGDTRIHPSSETTGTPTVIVHSQYGLGPWASLMAHCLYTVDIRKTDVFQNGSRYGMLVGGLGLQYGAECLGALIVPAIVGSSKRQIEFTAGLKTTALYATSSCAIRLAEVFQEEGIDPASTALRTLIIGAEPHTDEQCKKIERILGVRAHNSFGMTKMNGPGVAFECTEQNGTHFWEDYYPVEIINSETGKPVPDGEIGGLVLTILGRKMAPLIRYYTRDLTRIFPGECPCGRTHLRTDRIKGHSDDMFITENVNIFPMQVEKILVQFPELGSSYLITLETNDSQGEMIAEVELNDLSTDSYTKLEKIRKAVSRQLKNEILVTPEVKLVKKGSLS